MSDNYYKIVPIVLEPEKLIKTDENNYLANDGWAIQTLNGKIYYKAIDPGHGGRVYKIEVGRDALDYAKNYKPNSQKMDLFLKENGYTKVEWVDD